MSHEKKQIEPYERFSRALLQNSNLSIEALGALVRLFSFADREQWNLELIEKKILKCGRDRRRAIFRELEENGILVRTKNKNDVGVWEWKYSWNNPKITGGGKQIRLVAIDGKSVDGDEKSSPEDGFPGDGFSGDKNNTTFFEEQPLPPDESGDGEQKVPSGGENLIFPKSLPAGLLEETGRILARVQNAQFMLDELAVRLENRVNPVRDPIAFLKAIKKDFHHTPAGLELSRRREAAAKRKAVEERAALEEIPRRQTSEGIAKGKASMWNVLGGKAGR